MHLFIHRIPLLMAIEAKSLVGVARQAFRFIRLGIGLMLSNPIDLMTRWFGRPIDMTERTGVGFR